MIERYKPKHLELNARTKRIIWLANVTRPILRPVIMLIDKLHITKKGATND